MNYLFFSHKFIILYLQIDVLSITIINYHFRIVNMDLFKRVLHLEDAYGEIVEVRKPSIIQQEEFTARYQDLLKLGEKDYLEGLTFAEAYTTIKKYRRLVDNVLQVVGIDPKRLEMDTVAQLLYMYETENEQGEIVQMMQGALIEFIYGPPTGNPEASSIKKEEVQTLASVIGDLWAYTEDFQETMHLLNTLNYKDLNDILKARTEAMRTPEERAKKSQAEASKKLMENMKNKTKERAEDLGNKKVQETPAKMVELSEDEIAKFI